jgi:hypothetical protein
MSDLHCPVWGIRKSGASGHNSDRRGYASQKFEHEQVSSGLMNARLQLCQKELLRDSKRIKGSRYERQSLKANRRAEAR